jgi:hypothetical protein
LARLLLIVAVVVDLALGAAQLWPWVQDRRARRHDLDERMEQS